MTAMQKASQPDGYVLERNDTEAARLRDCGLVKLWGVLKRIAAKLSKTCNGLPLLSIATGIRDLSASVP